MQVEREIINKVKQQTGAYNLRIYLNT